MLHASSGKIANLTEMFLVDASVWVASADPDDRFYKSARALLRVPPGPILALDLTYYEVANALGRRHLQEVARDLCGAIQMRSRKALAVDPQLISSALDLARSHGLSVYDAAYLAAARLNGWTLVSLDGDLVSPGLAVLPEDA